MVTWARPSPQLKWHLDLFSSFFAGLTVMKDGPTDRQTDLATLSVTVGRIYIHSK